MYLRSLECASIAWGGLTRRDEEKLEKCNRSEAQPMGAMQFCHHHDRRVAKNRKLGFRGHVRSTKFDVDWERRCFTLVVSCFDKRSIPSFI